MFKHPKKGGQWKKLRSRSRPLPSYFTAKDDKNKEVTGLKATISGKALTIDHDINLFGTLFFFYFLQEYGKLSQAGYLNAFFE